MKVIATAKGYYGALIEPGQEFEVPEGTNGSWFEPVKGDDKATAKDKGVFNRTKHKDNGDDVI